MRTILFIVLSTFIAQISLAQQDTLIIKLNDYGQITILTSQLLSKKKLEPNIDKIYNDFYADFQRIDQSQIPNSSVVISYLYEKYDSTNRSIKIINEKEASKEFYFQDSLQQIVKSFNYTLSMNLYSRGYKEIEIAVNQLSDFDKISQLSIDSLYNKVQEDLLNRNLNNRLAYKIIYSQEKDHFNFDNTFVKKDKVLDQLSLNASFGMSIINSNFAPEISINAEFALFKQSKTKYKFGINTTFLFMPDKNDFFNVHTYNIANIYYSLFNYNKSSHMLSLGYMYRKTGQDFNGNTYTAAWIYSIKHVGIKFGGYFTQNLSGDYVAIPSIGFSFGF